MFFISKSYIIVKIILIIYFISTKLNAETIIYLYQKNYFTEVELLSFDSIDQNKKYYIRNFQYGRFLNSEEFNSIRIFL
ncbi:MAG: hypothetical protein KatS3mg129_2300 [Leptospiraceae bacterium]|nr:MAG: hypothetical protein KatS3mg129_2300 [Leptospiraceae bacterium]